MRFQDFLLTAREIDQARDQRGHLAELVDHVGQQPLAVSRGKLSLAGEHLDVRAQTRERSAKLVGSIRDELPLRA